MERPISSKALEQVKTAVFSGHKIAAIKIYCEDTGASLKDAKEAVEKLETEWGVTEPEKFTTPTKKKRGCGICLVIVLLVFGLIMLLLVLSRR